MEARVTGGREGQRKGSQMVVLSEAGREAGRQAGKEGTASPTHLRLWEKVKPESKCQ